MKTRTLMLMLMIIFTLGQTAIAETISGQGNGGNLTTADLGEMAGEITRELKILRVAREHYFSVGAFEYKVIQSKFFFTDEPLYIDVEVEGEIIQQACNAKNYPADNTIVIYNGPTIYSGAGGYVQPWFQLDENEKKELLLHEILGLMGVETSGQSTISSYYAELLKQNRLNDLKIEEIDKDTLQEMKTNIKLFDFNEPLFDNLDFKQRNTQWLDADDKNIICAYNTDGKYTATVFNSWTMAISAQFEIPEDGKCKYHYGDYLSVVNWRGIRVYNTEDGSLVKEIDERGGVDFFGYTDKYDNKGYIVSDRYAPGFRIKTDDKEILVLNENNKIPYESILSAGVHYIRFLTKDGKEVELRTMIDDLDSFKKELKDAYVRKYIDSFRNFKEAENNIWAEKEINKCKAKFAKTEKKRIAKKQESCIQDIKGRLSTRNWNVRNKNLADQEVLAYADSRFQEDTNGKSFVDLVELNYYALSLEGKVILMDKKDLHRADNKVEIDLTQIIGKTSWERNYMNHFYEIYNDFGTKVESTKLIPLNGFSAGKIARINSNSFIFEDYSKKSWENDRLVKFDPYQKDIARRLSADSFVHTPIATSYGKVNYLIFAERESGIVRIYNSHTGHVKKIQTPLYIDSAPIMVLNEKNLLIRSIRDKVSIVFDIETEKVKGVIHDKDVVENKGIQSRSSGRFFEYITSKGMKQFEIPRY